MDLEIQTKKIMRKAILSYSKEQNAEAKDTQIRIYSQEGEPKYEILKDFKDNDPVTELTLKQLMLVPKADFTGKGLQAMLIEPHIKNILIKLSRWEKLELDNTSVVIATNDNEGTDLRLILCKNKKPMKLVSFEKLFKD